MDFLCQRVYIRPIDRTRGEASMRLDLLLTFAASALIGWNLGNWLIPAAWLVVLCAATSLANLPRHLRRASGNGGQALRA
jgi:hypothetical protein